MIVKAFVGKIYEVQEFENIKGHWRNLDVVLRMEDRVTYSDGRQGVVREFLAIRVRGEQIDKFLAEVKENALIEAQVRFDCEERISTKGNVYLQNDMVFSCPEWKVIG